MAVDSIDSILNRKIISGQLGIVIAMFDCRRVLRLCTGKYAAYSDVGHTVILEYLLILEHLLLQVENLGVQMYIHGGLIDS